MHNSTRFGLINVVITVIILVITVLLLGKTPADDDMALAG